MTYWNLLSVRVFVRFHMNIFTNSPVLMMYYNIFYIIQYIIVFTVCRSTLRVYVISREMYHVDLHYTDYMLYPKVF